MEKRVIVILGPTASGKTALGIEVAEMLKSEIISADSRQFYRGLNIGTAKPTEKELEGVKHHLINSHDINEEYNAGKFEEDALKIISRLHKRNKIPVVVGGSGLYIKALVDGIINEAEADEEYRNHLLELRELKGNDYLYEMLRLKDPLTAAELLPQNWKRVIRALEVFKQTGKSIKEIHKEHRREIDLKFFQFGLSWERTILYSRIEERVDLMIEQGLVEEVKSILNAGYDEKLNSLNTVGYKEIIAFLKNEITLERAIELIKRNTRRYAKRQITWFKRDSRITWLNLNPDSDFKLLASQVVNIVLRNMN